MRLVSKLATFFIISLALITTVYSQSFLKTDGDKIVNESGQEILLKGYNLGGWLIMEGYMLHTEGFANAQWEIHQTIEDLIGETNAQLFYDKYFENYVRRADIDKLKEWGFNSVRLPFHYNILTPVDSPGVYLESGFAIIDSVISWCASNQMYLILDMHAAPGGQSAGPICDYNPAYPSLWEDPANQDRTVDIWRKIAERYANEKWIGGFDLLNEPAWDLGQNAPPLRDLYGRITDTIRVVDQNHILFIEGNWWATTFDGLTPPWDDNMVYSFHKYWNPTNVGTIQYLLDIRSTYNVPLWLGETGENSNVWFVNNVELMESHNIGWAFWPHKKIDAISGLLSAWLLPSYQELLDYWNGQGPQPTVEFATDALTQQAEKLSLSQCFIHRGIIDALIRQPYNNAIIPFESNEIPGIIYAANYDLGKMGFAYDDTDYENVGNGTWNNGWSYRNDGVDIEPCSDAFTLGYNVGWIEHGEWLKFTINVLQGGTFDINLRIAAQNSGGQILLKVDGQNLGSVVNVPVTGGWQNWQTITVENVALSPGTHVLQTRFFNGGFNFNYMEFVQLTVGGIENDNLKKTFKVYQNFPNPFNPSTKIQYEIPENGNVTIKLYDSLGSEITTLINEEQSAGTHQVNLSADKYNLSSGVYFYSVIFNDKHSDVYKIVLLK